MSRSPTKRAATHRPKNQFPYNRIDIFAYRLAERAVRQFERRYRMEGLWERLEPFVKRRIRETPPSKPLSDKLHAELLAKLANRKPQASANIGGLDLLEILDGRKHVIPIKFGHNVRAALNPSGTQLYFIGGNQELNLKALGIESDKDLVVVGPIHAFSFFASKPEGEPGVGRYVFGKEGQKRPTLLFDRLNSKMKVTGGAYTITRETLEWQEPSAGERS